MGRGRGRGSRSFLKLLAMAAMWVGVCAGWTAPAAFAVACPVTDGSELTEALEVNTECDPITLAPGTYTTVLGRGFSVDRTVTVVGAGAGTTTVTRSGNGSIWQVDAGGALSLSGVTVNGASNGSGIQVLSGSASVTNSVITGNTAGGGAGIVANTDATTFGGAGVAVTDSVISGNNATDSVGGGGALNLGSGLMRFERVLFSDNDSILNGGGFHLIGTGSAEFRNVTFTGNTANGDGGAIAQDGGAPTVTTLNNVTIAGNFADFDDSTMGVGGGIFSDGGVFRLSNSIIANNTDNAGTGDCGTSGGAQITRRGYELIRDPGLACPFGGAGDSATGYQTGVNPLLGALTTGSSSAGVLPLQPGSPATSAGNPSAPIGGEACEPFDQLNVPRGPPGSCDLGAAESAFAPVAPPSTGTPPPFNLAAALKKCKKKFRKGPKRKKCIRQAKKRAQ